MFSDQSAVLIQSKRVGEVSQRKEGLILGLIQLVPCLGQHLKLSKLNRCSVEEKPAVAAGFSTMDSSSSTMDSSSSRSTVDSSSRSRLPQPGGRLQLEELDNS